MSPTDVTPWYQEPQSGRIPSRSLQMELWGPYKWPKIHGSPCSFINPTIQVEFQLITLLITGSWAHFARNSQKSRRVRKCVVGILRWPKQSLHLFEILERATIFAKPYPNAQCTGIVTYIYFQKNYPNVGKYRPYIERLGYSQRL